MNFGTIEDMTMFLEDKAFYKGMENYCLGDTLEEAGSIVAMIAEEREGQKHVGMDT